MESIDRLTLADLERVVERGLATFVEVGAALLEIRDRRLYRLQHGTFEDYCQQRWGWSRQRAHQLIDATSVVRALSTTVDAVPANEAQAREMAPLKDEPDLIRRVWSEVRDRFGENVTAVSVREVVREYLPATNGQALAATPRAENPALHWNDAILRVDVLVSSIERLGGIETVTARWDRESTRLYLEKVRRLKSTFARWEAVLACQEE